MEPVDEDIIIQYFLSYQIIASVVDFGGKVSFVNNSVGSESAAVHLLSFGQIRLESGLNMTFDGNTGR